MNKQTTIESYIKYITETKEFKSAARKLINNYMSTGIVPTQSETDAVVSYEMHNQA